MGESERIGEAIKLAAGLECWKVGLSYGSVVYFELGEKRPRENPDAHDEVVGEATLWIEADDWRIARHGMTVADSETVDREVAELNIARAFLGQRFQGLTPIARGAELRFTGALRISVWKAEGGDMEPDDELLEMFLPDGRILCLSERKGVFIANKKDPLRANEWKARLGQ